VFAVQAMNANTAGDVETAKSKAKLSMILSGIGLGLGFVAGTIVGLAQNM
jgi:hypothetical protein